MLQTAAVPAPGAGSGGSACVSICTHADSVGYGAAAGQLAQPGRGCCINGAAALALTGRQGYSLCACTWRLCEQGPGRDKHEPAPTDAEAGPTSGAGCAMLPGSTCRTRLEAPFHVVLSPIPGNFLM
jgi:hypothetical protein